MKTEENKLNEIVSELTAMIERRVGTPRDDIKADSRFVEDLKFDSIDILELVMDAENEYNVELPDEQMDNAKTVLDVARSIQAQLV